VAKDMTKTDVVIRLAKRKRGVSGPEIVAATGWQCGSTKWHIEHYCRRFDLEYERIPTEGRIVRYRILSEAETAAVRAKKAKPKKMHTVRAHVAVHKGKRVVRRAYERAAA